MIYSENTTTQRHTISLGKLGQNKPYTLTGDAVFENGLKTFTTEGIQNVGIDILPNIGLDAKLVLLTSDASLVEVFCVLCPSGRYWNKSMLNRQTVANEELALYDVTAGTRRLLSSYGLTSEADWLRSMMFVNDFTNDRLYCFSMVTGQPIAYRTDVNSVRGFYDLHDANDERLMIFVSFDGFVRFYNHVMTRVATSYVSLPTRRYPVSAAFSVGAAYLAIVDTDKCLRVFARSGTAFTEVFSNSEYEWSTVCEDGPYGAATRFRASCGASRSFLYDTVTHKLTAEDGCAYGTAQTLSSGYPVFLTPDGVSVNGTDYPTSTCLATNSSNLYLATTDGKVIDGNGLTIVQASNPVAVLETPAGLFVVEQCGVMKPFTTDTSAPQLSSSVELTATGAKLTINVVGGEPKMKVTAAGTVYVNGVASQYAAPGSIVTIDVNSADFIGGSAVVAVGRSAVSVECVIDRVPDQFFIDDIAPMAIGEQRTITIELSGFNAETTVSSNGIIRVDGAVSDTVSPNQMLTLTVEQSIALYDSWWITVGTTTATFKTLQIVQHETDPVRSRAYAPMGITTSDSIRNTFDVPLIVTLNSEDGKFVDTLAREIVLQVGDSCAIECAVREFKHYDIKYTAGKTSHVFSVWADREFLDAEPSTPAAGRSVTAVSDPFSFSSIPDNFYMIASTPAGVDVILDGTDREADQDARQVDGEQQTFTLTNASVLQFRSIPNQTGRPLEFGSCTAYWHYPISIADNDTVARLYVQEASTLSIVYLPSNFVVRAQDAVSEVDGGSLVAVGMCAYSCALRSAQSNYAASVFDFVPQYAHSGSKFEPEAALTPVHTTESYTPSSAQSGHYYQLEALDQRVVQLTLSSADSIKPLAIYSQLAELDTLGFGLYQLPYHLAAAVNFNHGNVLSIASGSGLYPSMRTSNWNTIGQLSSIYCALRCANEWGSLVAYSEYVDAVFNGVALLSGQVVVDVPEAVELIQNPSDLQIKYDVEATAMDAQRQDKFTVPLRPKVRTAAGKSSGEIVLVAVDMKVVHSSAYAAYVPEFHAMQMLQWAPLIGEYEARRADDKVELLPNQYMSSIQHVEISASAVMTPLRHYAEIAFDTVYASVHELDWSGYKFSAASAALSYPKMEILTLGSVLHNGNPDLLDRGYFATEVLALQDAINVWNIDPAIVAARQLPSGEWYWIQVTTCANMCQGCPPTGYLSGG